MRKVVLGYEWDETFDPVPYEEPTHDGTESENDTTDSVAPTSSALSNPKSIELTTAVKPGLKPPPPGSINPGGVCHYLNYTHMCHG